MYKRTYITESEKKDIINLHLGKEHPLFENVVFTDWISSDNKYVIFMDQLIEIDTKTCHGDIWKNSDNLFLFLEHIYKVSKLPQTIKEEASRFFSKRLIMESKMDLSPIKHHIKRIILEDFWGDLWSGTKKVASATGKFIKDTAKETVKGISDTAAEAWQGMKDLGIAISKGDFREIMNLIGRGFLWTGRKIRQAAYSTVGIIIDAILVATGIGKAAQVVVWAIVVMVDIYEMVTGNYERPDEPLWLRVLLFGCDVLGLVFAGAAAKAARTSIKMALGGAKTAESAGAAIAKSPTMISILKKMVVALKELPSKLMSMSKTLGKGFWSELFSKALRGTSKFVEKILSSIKSMFRKKELRPVLYQIGLVGGIGTYTTMKDEEKKQLTAKLEKNKDKMMKDLSSRGDEILKTLQVNDPDFSDPDIFNV
jgi:hypothetical protein